MNLKFWTEEGPKPGQYSDDEVQAITQGFNREHLSIIKAFESRRHTGNVGYIGLNELQLAARSMQTVSETRKELEWLGSVGLVLNDEQQEGVYRLNSGALEEVVQRWPEVLANAA